MINEYSEDDYLPLSGIQHIAFCERQWALIHVEQAWADNVLTMEGYFLHERANDPFHDETRSDVRVVRALPLVSKKLGLHGVADVVEFYRNNNRIEGVTLRLKDRKGWWRPVPVEYKRGRPKVDDRDAVQLCAQGIALEEMLGILVEEGFIYYGQTRRRVTIPFTSELRERVKQLAERMHQLVEAGITPKAQIGKHCSLCSLKEICQPNLTLRYRSVKEYLARMTSLEVQD